MFQRINAATENERRPTVAREYARTCSRYDEDDNQADQQCQLANTGMVET